MKAITPQEARASQAQGKAIPDFVLGIVNALIEKHYKKSGFAIELREITAEILKHEGLTDESQLPKDWKRWLDFEPVYRSQGWNVFYDKPGYNEDSYPSRFQFSVKPRDEE